MTPLLMHTAAVYIGGYFCGVSMERCFQKSPGWIYYLIPGLALGVFGVTGLMSGG